MAKTAEQPPTRPPEEPQMFGDPAAVVGRAEGFIARYVVLPAGMPLVLGLWAAGTHLVEAFDGFPYLAVTSPTKRCGKTRLGEVLELICNRPRRAANVSEAVLFRMIENEQPTLIIDEAESLRDKRSERAQAVVALLNAGHRKGAVAYRCQGPNYDVREFKIYCPKVLIAIGGVPETIRDRSIIVQMQRRKPSEQVSRFLPRHVTGTTNELRGRLARAVLERREAIEQVYERLDLDFLEDREAENWAPLFSICSVLAPGRLAELRTAALANRRGKVLIDADDSLRMRLLADLRRILSEGANDTSPTEKKEDAVSSDTLVTEFRKDPEGPWDTLSLNQNKLARLLRPFGISPRQVWISGQNRRGYLLDELEDALARYL